MIGEVVGKRDAGHAERRREFQQEDMKLMKDMKVR
jgi:hypothetical protein